MLKIVIATNKDEIIDIIPIVEKMALTQVAT